MSTGGPASLTVEGLGWLQLAVGCAILLLPGLAAADRVAPSWRLRGVLAPVLSLTILLLTAIVAGFAVGLPLTPGWTVAEALAWTILLQRRRLRKGWKRLRRGAGSRDLREEDEWDDEEEDGADGAGGSVGGDVGRGDGGGVGRDGDERRRESNRRPRALVQWDQGAPIPRWSRLLALAAALALLWLVHSLPHMPPPPGEAQAPDLAQAPAAIVDRLASATTGDTGYPYPIHADEHVHVARAAEVERRATPFIGDPYTGQPGAAGILDLTGEVHERGFWVALAQIQAVTGAALPAIARFLPALWATGLGLLLWATLRPAPGAALSAAFLAILPTTPLFLGVGYLVPIGFGLPWVVATVALVLRSRGLVRVLAPFALITAAFFVHLVAGAACMLAAVAASLLRPGRPLDRAGTAVVLVIPLAWIWPAVRGEVDLNLGAIPLPTQPEILTASGWGVLALAGLGAVLAFALRRRALAAHRVFACVGAVLAATVLAALGTGHTSLALYYRPIHVLLLCVAAGAGLACGAAIEAAGRVLARSGARPWLRLVSQGVVALVAVLAVLPFALHAQAGAAQYHVFDAASWSDLEAFAAARPRADDVFLSDPWQAPMLNAVTGALPHTVLYPGSGTVNGGDYDAYVASGGADPGWLHERGITWIVSPVPPNATVLAHPGAHVYHIA